MLDLRYPDVSTIHTPSSLVSFISLCFLAVRQAREAALDAQLLVVATDLGKEKATQLFSEGTAFDPITFAEHLVSEFIVCTHYNCTYKMIHVKIVHLLYVYIKSVIITCYFWLWDIFHISQSCSFYILFCEPL